MLKHLPSLGGWLQIPSASVAQILARAGFDWVCVDLEHGAIDVSQLPEIFCAIERHGAVPVARVPALDAVNIRRVLDAGARGIILANAGGQGYAESLVEYCCHPPRGTRGWGYSRSNGWGADFNPHEISGNVTLVVQIESRAGLEHLGDMLAVDGIDAAFIGPLDLAGDMGRPGQPGHPDVRKACDRFVEICEAAGKPAGLHVIGPSSDVVKRTLAAGYSLLALGTDGVFLSAGAEAALEGAGR